MRPGDKVRFLHSTGEGTVRKIIDSKTVEVEIEDGFLIPALRSEIVLVHSDETDSVSGMIQETEEPASGYEGVWFAFVPFNDKIYSIHIINDASEQLLFTLGEEQAGNFSGIYSGTLKPGTSVKITDTSIASFDKWPEYIFQGLQFREGRSWLREPLQKRFRFKAASFFKSKQTVPLLKKEGYAFKVGSEPVSTDPKKIVEEMFTNKIADPVKKNQSKPAKEIDLHIENLVSDFSAMSNAEILDLQMKTFEKTLDNAIAMGMEEIVFIHGVGNGILRQNIHKILSRHKFIQFFQDAQKEKFGFGATLVKIR